MIKIYMYHVIIGYFQVHSLTVLYNSLTFDTVTTKPIHILYELMPSQGCNKTGKKLMYFFC